MKRVPVTSDRGSTVRRPDSPRTIIDFPEHLATEVACLEHLAASRLPERFVRPGCGWQSARVLERRHPWQCADLLDLHKRPHERPWSGHRDQLLGEVHPETLKEQALWIERFDTLISFAPHPPASPPTSTPTGCSKPTATAPHKRASRSVRPPWHDHRINQQGVR